MWIRQRLVTFLLTAKTYEHPGIVVGHTLFTHRQSGTFQVNRGNCRAHKLFVHGSIIWNYYEILSEIIGYLLQAV